MPLRVVAGHGAQGRPFKLVKPTQTGKIAAETASNTVTTENNHLIGRSIRVAWAWPEHGTRATYLAILGHLGPYDYYDISDISDIYIYIDQIKVMSSDRALRQKAKGMAPWPGRP